MVVWLAKVEHHEYVINWGRWLVPSRGMLIPVKFNSRHQPPTSKLQFQLFLKGSYLLHTRYNHTFRISPCNSLNQTQGVIEIGYRSCESYLAVFVVGRL